MKKKISLVIILSCICFNLFSQSYINPEDSFYKDVNRWEISGYIDSIPQVRPYSYHVIKTILENVINCEERKEAELAEKYMDVLINKGFNVSIEAETDISRKDNQIKNNETGTLRFTGALNLDSMLSMNYDFGVTGAIGDFCLPEYRTTIYDMVDDPTTIGPVNVNLNFNNLLSYGTDKIGIVAGISRSSFGQFPEYSIVLDASSFHAPYINLYVNRPSWSYTQSTYFITATDNFGNGSFTEKFLNLHNVSFRLLPNLTLSYYETMISGGKTDFQYVLPCPYMISQAFGDFADNLQMGIGVTYKPLHGLKLTGDLYVDDISANDVVKFNFDTKMVIAAQLSAQYVPTHSAVSRLYAETIMLSPRMYAHSDVSTNKDGSYHYALGSYVNYQNYTHKGECIAAKIWPNSIACTIGGDIEPFESLKFSFATDFICHANVNETIEYEEAKKYLKASENSKNSPTDGSVLNFPGFPYHKDNEPENDNINDYPASYLNHFPYLEQPTKQYIVQLNTGLIYSFKLAKSIDCSVSLNNVFEYIKNNGVQNEIFTASNIAEPTEDDVSNALNNWRAAIIQNTFNDYLTLSAKINF